MPELPHELCALWLALLFDVLFKEPPNALHPVAWLGSLILAFRRRAPKHGRWGPLAAGALFMLAGIVIVAMLGFFLQRWFRSLPAPFSLLAEAAVLKLTFSVRALAAAGSAVRSALEARDLADARRLLGWHLVSRDTSTLNESQVAAATIESLAENTSDSFVAPLFFYLVAGLAGAWAYRFINTCDAMLGYRDAEREWLGKFAARIDDFVNFPPARLTAGILLVAGMVLGSKLGRAIAVWRRDRHATSSPNAGHPMSAAAGILGVELEKVGHYRLGYGERLPDSGDIGRAIRLFGSAVLLAALSISAVLYAIR